jgi:hypothetical protein
MVAIPPPHFCKAAEHAAPAVVSTLLSGGLHAVCSYLWCRKRHSQEKLQELHCHLHEAQLYIPMLRLPVYMCTQVVASNKILLLLLPPLALLPECGC